MKALIAMSGGVDSSVAALLIRQKGFDCVGCTMKLYDAETENGCCSLANVEDARAVARKLGFPYYVFNFTADFRTAVIDRFIECYRRGETPNPCVDCNRYLKFDRLFRRARELGCDYIVTGHYARIEREGEKWTLKKAADPAKDQSYVLYNFTQEQLAHTLLPLGNMRKEETRLLAAENGLITAGKPDSQDICFVPDGDYARVIEEMTGEQSKPGDFVDTAGRVMGRHRGLIHYTVGQRKGLGLALPEPYFVVRLEPETNRVVLGVARELMGSALTAGDFH